LSGSAGRQKFLLRGGVIGVSGRDINGSATSLVRDQVVDAATASHGE